MNSIMRRIVISKFAINGRKYKKRTITNTTSTYYLEFANVANIRIGVKQYLNGKSILMMVLYCTHQNCVALDARRRFGMGRLFESSMRYATVIQEHTLVDSGATTKEVRSFIFISSH